MLSSRTENYKIKFYYCGIVLYRWSVYERFVYDIFVLLLYILINIMGDLIHNSGLYLPYDLFNFLNIQLNLTPSFLFKVKMGK